VTGLLVGRFQAASRMTRELLEMIVWSKPELRGLPVVANLDFGHTSPMITFPVGGQVEVAASATGAAVRITRH
jgi:muramoyltetrapeptide carboxypeptidase LdcA involved in peptidoglycan recycling